MLKNKTALESHSGKVWWSLRRKARKSMHFERLLDIWAA